MKTVPLPRKKTPTPREMKEYFRKYADILAGANNAAIVGLGNAGLWFLEAVMNDNDDKEYFHLPYPYNFVLFMDSNHAAFFEDGLNKNEVKYIYNLKKAKKRLDELEIPEKEFEIFNLRKEGATKILKKIWEDYRVRFSQLILATPSSDKLAGLNKNLVYDAIEYHDADIVLAVKNVLNNTKDFNKIMCELSRRKRYIGFNAACGVRSLIPTVVSNYSSTTGDISIEGIYNASTNLFIECLENGYTIEEALKELENRGTLEPEGKISGEAPDIFKKIRMVENIIQYLSPEGADIGSFSKLPFDEDLIKQMVDETNEHNKSVEKEEDKLYVKIVGTTQAYREKGRRPRIDSSIDFKQIPKSHRLADIKGINCGVALYRGKNNTPIGVTYGPGAGKATGDILFEDSKTIYYTNRPLISTRRQEYEMPLIVRRVA